MEPFGLELELRDVRAGEWLARQTPLGNHIDGMMDLSLSLAGGLDTLLLPTTGSLSGGGSIGIRNGAIAPNPLSRAIGAEIGAAGATVGRLDSWESDFAIADGALVFEDGKLALTGAEIDLAGSAGFDGALDLNLRVRPVGLDLPITSGSLGLGLRVGGRIEDPAVTLDPAALDRAGEAAVDEALSEIERRGLELLRRLTEERADTTGTP